MSFTQKFLSNPTSRGLNYEKIKAIDPALRSVRINGSYRAIIRIPDESAKNTYFLLWVDAHDAAYDWAKRKTLIHDTMTNSISLIEVTENTEEKSAEKIIVDENDFSPYSDLELKELGIEESTLFMIRAVKNKVQLEDAKKFLASPVYDNLNYLLSDIPYDEVLELYHDSFIHSSEQRDIDTAIHEDINKNKFFVSKSEEDDMLLEKYFQGALDEWRLFLHPKQNRYVEADYQGPVRILGGPGTGKSGVAMHRAKYLLENLYDKPHDRILFTTLSTNLSEDLEDILKKILSPKDFSRIDIVNIDKVIYTLSKKYFDQYKIVYEDDLEKLWDRAYVKAATDVGIPVSLCISEYHQVILQNHLLSRKDYFLHKRIGRGTQLNRNQKRQIWDIIETYRKLMDELKEIDIQTAEIRLENYLKLAYPQGLYQSVIVDEVQDFRQTTLKLIRALAGEEKTNDLFLVGDNLQRIYLRNTTIDYTGINLKERSYTLTHNYRITNEIATLAKSIVEDLPKFEPQKGTQAIGDFSPLHGSLPLIETLSSMEEEYHYVLKTLKLWKAKSIPEESICILVRTKQKLNR